MIAQTTHSAAFAFPTSFMDVYGKIIDRNGLGCINATASGRRLSYCKIWRKKLAPTF
jgi:hypothetical protein